MAASSSKDANPTNRLILTLAVTVFVFDQFAKWLVLELLPVGDERNLIPGFFKFVHWGNTGAAWSLFSGNNAVLAVVGIGALILLVFTRRHFHAETLAGQIAFGLIFPAFNIADSAICTGVALIFLLSWKNEQSPQSAEKS